LNKFVFLVIVASVSACGVIKDRSTEYAQAEYGKPLIVPESLSDSKIRSVFPIPSVGSDREVADSFELPRPPNGTAALSKEPFSVESVGGQMWLRLETSPGKVWPLLDLFWEEYGIDVLSEEISQGFVTAYTANLDSELKAKITEHQPEAPIITEATFQASLVQGVRRNTAELQLRVLDSNQTKQVDLAKLVAPQNPKVEQAILSLIGEFVTSEDLQNRYSLLANDIGGDARVRLMKTQSGDSFIELDLSFQRAWSELGKALKSAGVLVSDIDLSQKSYFISYLNEESITKWYRTSDQSDEKSKERNYRLLLEQSDDKVFIRVKRLNEALDIETGLELLNIVFEHIS